MTKRVWFIIFICTIFIVATFIYSNKAYPSPEEALMNYKDFEAQEIIEKVTDKGMAIIMYKNRQGEFDIAYLREKGNGWVIIPKITRSTSYTEADSKIFCYPLGGKYILGISSLAKRDPPYDNIGSTIQLIYFKDADYCYNWFLVLDKLPKGYKLYYSGKAYTFFRF